MKHIQTELIKDLNLHKASKLLKEAAAIDYPFLCKEKDKVNFHTDKELKLIVETIEKKKY